MDIASTHELLYLKSLCDNAYFEGTEESPLSDDAYDSLVAELVSRGESVEAVGCKPSREDAVTLPFYMPSLDKFKPADSAALKRWAGDCDEFVLEDKLDGVSCLWVCDKGEVRLYTRGDSTSGRDISHLRRCINNVDHVHTGTDYAVRGELIMRRSIFQKKYAETAKNPRNLVSGAINAKTLRPCTWHISFVAYEVLSYGAIYDTTVHVPAAPASQLFMLKNNLGFETVAYTLSKGPLSVDHLVMLVTKSKEKSLYDMDGIVIVKNQPFRTKLSGNPDHAKAFKNNSDTIPATVVAVHWNTSRHGLLKPRVEIAPVSIGGVVISYVTGHNAKFIQTNKIGPGAVVSVSRSGDVIPKIETTIVPSKEPWSQPENSLWNNSKVELIASDGAEEDPQRIKEIANFFSVIGAKHVSLQTVTKLYNHGLCTVPEIIFATHDQLCEVPEIQTKSATRIQSNIETALQSASLSTIVTASGTLGQGFGKTKIDLLLSSIPEFLDEKADDVDLHVSIEELPGFSETSAEKLVANRDKAIAFLTSIEKALLKNKVTKPKTTSTGNVYLFTGFRDKDLSQKLEDEGNKVASSFTKAVTHLVVDNSKDPVKSTLDKIQKAKDAGISVVYRHSL